jgi:hypothetical protein
MCAKIIVGGVFCGFDGDCQHKRVSNKPRKFAVGDVLKLNRPHSAYSPDTLFLCVLVDQDRVYAKSHYGTDNLGPTLLWPHATQWFDHADPVQEVQP